MMGEELVVFDDTLPANTLVIANTGGPIVTIGPGGKVTLGKGAEVDEAAQVFWAAVERITTAASAGWRCPHCGKGGAI